MFNQANTDQGEALQLSALYKTQIIKLDIFPPKLCKTKYFNQTLIHRKRKKMATLLNDI